ncbi:MAG: nucleoside hydrolase, partial [bacterium]|nr:nucleoside hydrolase [bacterium]
FFALKSHELDVIGLTTIFGNCHTALATTNALRLLEIAGRTDIPVAQGAAHSLTGPFILTADSVHGEDGQGNLYLPEPSTQPISLSAAQFIVEQVMAAPGEITLVPIGPLTNLALALHLEPRVAENVKEVVLMGGNALVPGNVSPAAEANIHNDPEAADIVFGAPWPVTMVGLDVTHKVNMTAEHLAEYARFEHPMNRHITACVPYYRAFMERFYGMDGIYVHDSTAIAYLLDRSLFRTEAWPIRVETQGISRGKTWPSVGTADAALPWQGRPRVNVCVDVDAEKTIALELSRLG